MKRPPCNVPDSEAIPKLSHEDLDRDYIDFIASGGKVQVIESRPPSPLSHKSCSDIR
jgi:hypothetical protein